MAEVINLALQNKPTDGSTQWSAHSLAAATGISITTVHRWVVKAFLGQPLDHARFPYVYLDDTYLHGRLGRNIKDCSRAVVAAIGIYALGYLEVLGIAVGDGEAEGFWCQFLGSLKERRLDSTRLVISDAHLGLTAAIRRMFQGCPYLWMLNGFSTTSSN